MHTSYGGFRFKKIKRIATIFDRRNLKRSKHDYGFEERMKINLNHSEIPRGLVENT